MLPLMSIGIVAGLLVGILCVVAAGKLNQLFCCKKKRITSESLRPVDLQLKPVLRICFFCWSKPVHNTNNNNVAVEDVDVELELGLSMKSFVEEGVEAELMRLHNLSGPRRFLFTIKEETLEDLASEDGSRKLTCTRLIDLMRATDADSQLSPAASPVRKTLTSSPLCHSSGCVNNPLFECSAVAELNRLMSSPPPKFKFLRDAEEKLMKKIKQSDSNSSSLATLTSSISGRLSNVNQVYQRVH